MIDNRILEIIDHARTKSPYYRELYTDLPTQIDSLNQVPRVNHQAFWAANSNNLRKNNLLTEPFTNGTVFRTGGTTGEPKSSFYTRQDLDISAATRARCLLKVGLQPGDRVANLMNAGNMYKGFPDLSDALSKIDIPNVHLAIGGVAGVKHQAWAVKEFEATVIVAMPTSLCRLANYFLEHGDVAESVRLVLFSGELMYREQKVLILNTFPNARVGAQSYGSVDAGLIGMPVSEPDTDPECQASYQVDLEHVVLELLDESGNNICEEGVPGEVVITSLSRRLMPIIRYSMGDVATWTNFDSRQFQVLGRSTVGVTLGQSRFDLRDLRAVILRGMDGETIHGFQILLRRSGGKDEMVFRIAAKPQEPESCVRDVQAEMERAHDVYYAAAKRQYFNPLVVEFVYVDDFIYNERSGKLMEVVDLRLSDDETAVKSSKV